MKSLGASLHLGAVLYETGTTFRVWAPRCRAVEVVIEGRRPTPLNSRADGLFELALPGVGPSTRYQYRLDGERYRPDPASRHQPEGVHGPSVVVDGAGATWTDQGFRGHALADLVFYELHVGTFTAAGTFEAVIPHLPQLVDLGVTAIELMPIGEFPGSRNWGYDGVHLFAPQSTYGGPRGLRRLVDAAHGHGLSVVLDVVYNHLGPEGNYLGEYGPYYTDRYKTPWGTAINFDGPDSEGVRRHFVENARYWVREFHVDGLRLDAIHSIFDQSPVHILTELAEAAREEARLLDRPVHVIAESHDNDRRIVLPASEGGIGLDAVWADDFHHAIHAASPARRAGYYVDFVGGKGLGRALAEGFAFQGEPSEYFGRARGHRRAPISGASGSCSACRITTRWAIAPRVTGSRPSCRWPRSRWPPRSCSPRRRCRCSSWARSTARPHRFSSSPRISIRRSTRPCAWAAPRSSPGSAGRPRPPDPGKSATFLRSRLNHSLAGAPRHRELREYYRRWLALRRTPSRARRSRQGARAVRDRRQRQRPHADTARRRAGAASAWSRTSPSTARPYAPPSADWRDLLDSEDPRFAGNGMGRPLAPYQAVLYEVSRRV